MRIKRRDLKLLVENLLNEAVKNPSDKRWTVIRIALNMILQKKMPDFKDPKTFEIKDWGADDDALLKKVTGVDEVDGDPIQVGKALKAKLDAVIINGKRGEEGGLYDNVMRYLEDESKTEDLIAKSTKKDSEKPAEKSAKKAEDVSGQEGKIIQDPSSAGYHYKKIGDKHYIISSPKDKKVSEKNATFVDPQSMKGAYDAILKLFK